MTIPHAIITDIEGTTSSIRFVKDVLFPYAREHLPAFVHAHASDTDARRWLDATAREAEIDPGDLDGIIAALIAWIDTDRKATPLKALQGMIWADGYASNAYRAHLYPEVATCLRDWHTRGIRLYVYSSGSVPAQKLFFSYSTSGDLTPLINGWFDTETGPKREVASYQHIAAAIGEAPADCLFLSDISAELDAASTTGMHTVQLCRPPEPCPADGQHVCVANFDDIAI